MGSNSQQQGGSGVTIYVRTPTLGDVADCRECPLLDTKGNCMISSRKRSAGSSCEYGLSSERASELRGDYGKITAFLAETASKNR
jgi:hypothetical protein